MNIPEKWFFKGTKESEKQAKNSNYYKYFHNNFGTSYGFFKNIVIILTVIIQLKLKKYLQVIQKYLLKISNVMC